MAAPRRTAAARSAARTRPRSIAAPPMPAAIWRRTSSRRDWPTAARCRSATRSASPHPLSVYVDLHGNRYDVSEAKLEATLRELVNLSPRGIREHLHLNRPIYARDLRLRAFRPRAGRGEGHVHLGEDRSGAGAALRLREPAAADPPGPTAARQALKPPPDRLYGRARGHALRPRQERLLAEVAAAPAARSGAGGRSGGGVRAARGGSVARSGLRQRRARAGAGRARIPRSA